MINSFLNRLDKLTDDERIILTIYAIVHHELPKTTVWQILQERAIYSSAKKPFTQLLVKEIIHSLTSLHLLILKRYYIINDRYIDFIFKALFHTPLFQGLLRPIRQNFPASLPFHHIYPDQENFLQNIRDLRIAIYAQDARAFETHNDILIKNFADTWFFTDILSSLMRAGVSVDEILNYPENIRYTLLTHHFKPHFLWLPSFSLFSDYLYHHLSQNNSHLDYDLLQDLFQIMVYRGNPDKVEKTLSKIATTPAKLATAAWLRFLRTGTIDNTVENFELSIKLNRKLQGKRTLYLTRLYGVYYIIILLYRNDKESLTKATLYINQYLKGVGIFKNAVKMLEIVLTVKKGHMNAAEHAILNLEDNIRGGEADLITMLFFFYTLYWVMPDQLPLYQAEINELSTVAGDNGYKYIASEIDLIWESLSQKENIDASIAKAEKKLGMKSMLPFMKQEKRWEQILSALTQYDSEKQALSTAEKRLIWLVNFDGRYPSIQPKEQNLGKKGKWSKGKNVSLKRLSEEKLTCMTQQDIIISKSISQEYQGYYEGYRWEIDYNKALPALCSHPLLFHHNSPDTPVEVTEDELELFIEEKGSGFTLFFSENFEKEQFIIHKKSSTRYKLIKITKKHREIREIIGGNKITFPTQAKQRISAIIDSLSASITVHSSAGEQAKNIPLVDADSRMWIHLLPFEQGLTCEMYVKPFGSEGPAFQPGIGGKTIVAKTEGKRVQTTRNLPQESKKSGTVISKSSSLQKNMASDFIWELPHPHDALTLLSELQSIGKSIVVAWPKGGAKRIVAKATMKNLSLNIKKENDWFEMSGNITIDKERVYEMSALIDLARKATGRFIELGENDYIELTQELMKKLKFLSTWNNTKKKNVIFHPLNALAIDDITEDAGKTKSDSEWKKLKKKISDAFSQTITPPSTFQAELRDYQLDGFIWLSRLSAIGAGACLADDMGLGKTIQALASIVQRGGQGATLVVAPASVGFNWAAEIERFAPTLTVKIFGDEKRDNQIKSLQPNDVLITTYGLMTNEIKMLKDVLWSTIVFDEAQAIKNAHSKRTLAALKLKSSFKIITTGTPIENNLSELWSLFNLINPGFLGTEKEFNTQFAIPIEKEGSREVRNQLKKIIQPLILRRRKNDVLDELPEKTEITLAVEMSAEERAFYEALREEAVLKMTNLESGAGHIEIFAEIMKLRRASCNPELILKKQEIVSTKLLQFEKLIKELKENNHKVLVFSQFVDHLAILKRRLEELGVSYNYLDGSTPRKKRAHIVNSFQSGESDVFLISLKAGGTGLNLTAANFVIHMDPWWNPAVEDQASDRAHRIGQTQPVTIYRIIAKNSIEEKILALHKTKRNLADGLLEGSDSAAKLTAKDLIALMR